MAALDRATTGPTEEGAENGPELVDASEDGREIQHSETSAWEDTPIPVGSIMEFALHNSSFPVFEECWGALLVETVDIGVGDGRVVTGLILGAEEVEGSQDIRNSANLKGHLLLHLCSYSPCSSGAPNHISIRRVWNPESFHASYLSKAGFKELTNLLKEKTKKDKPGRGVLRRGAPKEAPKEKGTAKRKADPKEPKEKKEARKKPPPDAAVDLEDGTDVQERLQDLRRRVQEKRPRKKESEEDRRRRSAVESSRMTTAVSLVPRDRREMRKSSPLAIKDGSISDGKMKTKKKGSSPGEMLLAQAAQREKIKKAEAKKKKKEKPEAKLARALTEALLGKKKEKKGKKKKKKKKRKEGGGDPQGSGGGSGGESSEEEEVEEISSEDDGEGSESGQSEKTEASDASMEAPLRRKSAKRPGSVMEMLIKQAAFYLDQNAILENGTEGVDVVEGVRIASYFSLMIRPYHPPTHPMVRELYSLAQTIDCLRSGQLGLAADALAGRFVAVHQALEDGGWASASALEIHPLETASSASVAMLLKAQKHRRLLAKSQGWEGPKQNKGGGGKGGWQQNWTYQGGKGKEKGKPKGKSKGGYQQNQNQYWTQRKKETNTWQTNKEDPKDKGEAK